jgi:hypothetical protein
MTGTSARNHYGIFENKTAKNLAILYNLDLYNKNAYVHSGKLIHLHDVQFIVDNFWLDYFMGLTEYPPITLPFTKQNDIVESLKINYPHFDCDYSWA